MNEEFWNNDDEDYGSLEDLLSAYFSMKEEGTKHYFDVDDYEAIIDYLFQNNREIEALEACEYGLNFFPNSEILLLLHAEILFQSQKFKQALNILDQIEEANPTYIDAIILRTDIYISQLKAPLAAEYIQERLHQFESKEQIDLLFQLADIYDEVEEYEKVFDTLKKILEINPYIEEALHKISFWADFEGLHDQSIELHKKLLDDDPFNALAWFNIGASYQAKKEYKNAIEAYEYCVAIDDKYELAYRNLADAYIRLNWYEKAIESLERNLEFGNPEDVIFEALGHCFEKQKDFEKARYFYRKAIELSPNEDGIFYRIGNTYLREKEWEKAVKSFSTALQINKENANYYLALGNALIELEAYNEALLCFYNALKIKPHNITNWNAIIKLLIIMEEYESALEQVEMANDLLGDRADFNYFKTAALLNLGKSKEALIYFEMALDASVQKLKVILELEPDLLQRKPFAQLVARYKKK